MSLAVGLRLVALRARALRLGVWRFVSPTARALIEATILFLRRGGRIKSQTLLAALESAVKEVLQLVAPLRLKAIALGRAVARERGVEVDEERALALGLQILNTPRRWRAIEIGAVLLSIWPLSGKL
ncbi:hypothetical protein [Thermoproteus tenax]|uniref:Uncharacterized protein n=1 Tax=Thermoproteus tenax (strain ATCC 35583 / DSM 2078 / JCM 9277 / NBRC 100435 / Kra 1) TaxID=768679 RepID=G4RKA8_THETK|nr:hypothetical protein [Thermoproteus tenax]CCC82003.1 conserved hypothetical protein [Thermoproteus tenax Kra 1]